MLAGCFQKPMHGVQVNRCHPFAQGQVSAYPFNEYHRHLPTTRGTWFNDGCKQNDARIHLADVSKINPRPGRFGFAPWFHQSSIPLEGVYTDFSGNNSQNITGQISFSAWIWVWSGSTTYRPMFCRQDGANTTRWLYIGVTGGGQNFEIRYYSGGEHRTISGPSLVAYVDQWIQVGFTFNYLQDKIRWFVNGQCVDEDPIPADLEVYGGKGWQLGHADGESFSWKGSHIDNVFIFNQVICDQAMQAFCSSPYVSFERAVDPALLPAVGMTPLLLRAIEKY